MALKKYDEEAIAKMSMIELANIILSEQKKEMNFIHLFDKVAEVKGFTQTQKDDLLARFYTDMNIDGRFTTLGSNVWGLKRWYPVEQTSEKSLAETRKRDLEDEEALDDELHVDDIEDLDDLKTEEANEGFDDYDSVDYDEA